MTTSLLLRQRIWMALMLTLCSVFCASLVAFADDGISVILNGETLSFDQAPLVEEGTTLVPMRAIFEKYNMTVNYYAETKTVTARDANNTISLILDSNTAYVNGQAVQLRVAPKIIGERTMVPLRFVSESLGVAVGWDENTKTVHLKAVPGIQMNLMPAKIKEALNYGIENGRDALQKWYTYEKLPDGLPYKNWAVCYSEYFHFAELSASGETPGDPALISQIAGQHKDKLLIKVKLNNDHEMALKYKAKIVQGGTILFGDDVNEGLVTKNPWWPSSPSYNVDLIKSFYIPDGSAFKLNRDFKLIITDSSTSEEHVFEFIVSDLL